MSALPERHQQIVQVHAALIVQVVKACQDRDMQVQLKPALKAAKENGWSALVGGLEAILGGKRELTGITDLDEEDAIICEAVLRGLQDPTTLPDPDAKPDGSMAAPAIAALIHGAGTGDVGALQQIGVMAEQMSNAGGDLARVAACIRPMVNGERDANKLCRKMGPQTESLIQAILGELAKLAPH